MREGENDEKNNRNHFLTSNIESGGLRDNNFNNDIEDNENSEDEENYDLNDSETKILKPISAFNILSTNARSISPKIDSFI